MGVSSLHPLYKFYQDAMVDCRNAFEGSRAIKALGIRYLPALKGQITEDYNSYKGRALFFSITGKTVSALVGMVMGRTPITKYSERMKPYFEERQGAQFLEICSTTTQEVLLEGGYGLFIDASVEGSDPQIVRYCRESIINWRTDEITGKPTMIMLKETIAKPKTDDEYEVNIETQYRKLWLSGQTFVVSVYNEKGEQVSQTIPTVRRRPLNYIPFYMINPLGVSMEVFKPPMLDIVDLNLSHYRTSADLEHGRHFTGLPTPVVSGIEGGGSELYIGSQSAWTLPNPDAKAYYLEFTGQGLGSLEKAMVEKQSQMASMSARLIDNSKRGSEAAETVRLRYMSETSSLVTVVRSVEDGLNQVYADIADILGEPPPVIQMNKEFMDTKMSAADLTAIVKAYLEGALSKETLIYNLRKGDIISPKQEDAAEAAAILEPGAGREANVGQAQ